MSTNASISVKHADGTFSTVYLHWDGDSYAFGTLSEHHNTLEKAEALVALGSISVLAESTECPEGHSFETPVKGVTIAYHRDRGEDWEQTKPTKSEFLFELGYDHQYHYIFADGKWQSLVAFKSAQ